MSTHRNLLALASLGTLGNVVQFLHTPASHAGICSSGRVVSYIALGSKK